MEHQPGNGRIKARRRKGHRLRIANSKVGALIRNGSSGMGDEAFGGVQARHRCRPGTLQDRPR